MHERRYDLDWLRIAAFGVLILYHIGMVFVPWGFHIKTAATIDWLEPMMLLPNAWRLALLFLISGIASRAMLDKNRDGFGRRRSARLFVPLVAAMILWVPPQAFVDLVVNFDYRQDFGHFWRHDYFRFNDSLGIVLPTWNHLWFVAYLWVYTLILAGLMLLPAPLRALAQRCFDRLFTGPRLLLVPVLFHWAVRMLLADRFPETHALADDWCAHLIYGAAFGFGVGIGPKSPIWASIARYWKACAAAGLAGWAVVAAINTMLPGDSDLAGWPLAGARLARAVQAWGMIVALLGMAQAWWQKDHPWRRILSEAVFPAYIAHQTVIVVVMFWLLPLGLPPLAEFAILLVATVSGCVLFTLAGYASGPLRPLFGLAMPKITRRGWPRSAHSPG